MPRWSQNENRYQNSVDDMGGNVAEFTSRIVFMSKCFVLWHTMLLVLPLTPKCLVKTRWMKQWTYFLWYSEKALEEETRTEYLIQPDQSVQTKALAGLNVNYLFPEVQKDHHGGCQTNNTHCVYVFPRNHSLIKQSTPIHLCDPTSQLVHSLVI